MALKQNGTGYFGKLCMPGFFFLVSLCCAKACIWDAVTLEEERARRPNLAQAVEGTFKTTNDLTALRAKIQKLESAPQDNVDWLNELAGAYLRVGESKRAVTLLQPAIHRFPDNYGIHANLGTAYHLLGDYKAAEKEIARDLEINPEAHFGLERYHLALLQYLIRDQEYQTQHVYIDEWTKAFTNDSAQVLSHHINKETGLYSPAESYYQDIVSDASPAYRRKWNLASDPKFEEGIIYMASLNPQQPACFTMLGIACLAKRDFNLARMAFQKAIALGSPQTELLKQRIAECDEMIRESHPKPTMSALIATGITLVVVAGAGVFALIWFGRFVYRKAVAQKV